MQHSELKKTSLSISRGILEELCAEFPKSEVRQRSGGRGITLDYIDIVQTIKRFQNVLGEKWNWEPLASECSILPGITDNRANPVFLAHVRGNISIFLPDGVVTRGGVGADKDADPDKALKTADAEALKKAGHKFLVALYLWDKEKLAEIAEFRNIAQLALPALQKLVAEKAGTKKPEEIAKLYGIDPSSLKSRQALLQILDMDNRVDPYEST